MIRIITKDEFDRNIFDLSLHGVPKEELDNMRNKFNGQIDGKEEIKENSFMEKMKLKDFGFHFGKKNKTKVINR